MKYVQKIELNSPVLELIRYIEHSFYSCFVIYCIMKLFYNLMNSVVFSNTLFLAVMI